MPPTIALQISRRYLSVFVHWATTWRLKTSTERLAFDFRPKAWWHVGGVDAGQADLVLPVPGIEDRDRIAIGDAHHATLDRRSADQAGCQHQDEGEQDFHAKRWIALVTTPQTVSSWPSFSSIGL